MAGGRCTAPAWAAGATLGRGRLGGLRPPCQGGASWGVLCVCGKAGGEKVVLGRRKRGNSGRSSFKASWKQVRVDRLVLRNMR